MEEAADVILLTICVSKEECNNQFHIQFEMVAHCVSVCLVVDKIAHSPGSVTVLYQAIKK